MKKNTEKSFWDKVDRTSDCWLWKESLHKTGYAYFKINNKKILAHVYSFELTQPKPVGMFLDHLCRVRHCVNPKHLELVTPRENTIRGKNVVERVVSLPLGVNPNHKRFMANKRFEGKVRYLGTFDTPAEAHKAYMEAV